MPNHSDSACSRSKRVTSFVRSSFVRYDAIAVILGTAFGFATPGIAEPALPAEEVWKTAWKFRSRNRSCHHVPNRCVTFPLSRCWTSPTLARRRTTTRTTWHRFDRPRR